MIDNEKYHKQLNSPLILIILITGTFCIIIFAYKALKEADSIYESTYSMELIDQ